MTRLIKDEELFLKLLLKQDWDNDIQAYLKFREELPESLLVQKSKLTNSLQDKGYIIQKYIRQYTMLEPAKTYFKNKKINKIKDIFIGLYRIFKELISIIL